MLRKYFLSCIHRITCLTVQQYVTDSTAIFVWLYGICDWVYSIMWPTVQQYATYCTAIRDWLYSNMCQKVQQYVTVQKYMIDVQQYVTDRTAIYDLLYSNTWLTLRQYMTECTVICLYRIVWSMYSNMWLTVQQYLIVQKYVIECTAICDRLYSNMWMTFQQYVSDCTSIWLSCSYWWKASEVVNINFIYEMMCTENTLMLIFLSLSVECMLYGVCVLKLANKSWER